MRSELCLPDSTSVDRAQMKQPDGEESSTRKGVLIILAS